jgi:hypothetical protein
VGVLAASRALFEEAGQAVVGVLYACTTVLTVLQLDKKRLQQTVRAAGLKQEVGKPVLLSLLLVFSQTVFCTAALCAAREADLLVPSASSTTAIALLVGNEQDSVDRSQLFGHDQTRDDARIVAILES